MFQLALSDSFEYLFYGSTAGINMFTLTVRRSTLVVRIVYRRQIPTTKVVPRAARVKIELEVVGRGSATQLQMGKKKNSIV